MTPPEPAARPTNPPPATGKPDGRYEVADGVWVLCRRDPTTANPADLHPAANPAELHQAAHQPADPVALHLAADPLQLHHTADPMQLRHAADPMQLHHTADPMRSHHTADAMQLRHAADPLRSHHTADPMQLRHAADSLEPHQDDLDQAAGFPPWRAAEFLAGRATLRRLIREVRPDLADSAVRPDAWGRPGLVGHPDVGVSISHDGGLSAAALAPGRRVGVDVQLPPDGPSDGMLRRLLREHAAPLERLPAPERARELAWVWTVQESCVKAAGTGLAGRPWAIAVPPGRRYGRWGRYRWASLRDTSPIPLSCAFTAREDPDSRVRTDAPPADLECRRA
ncbi:4'-phosphopantetheinyl transferase superfamily protein [Streptomyces humi]|uniref:4'-phosphopantetheinyl transferase superfamily protein n=1 Tax=Streptomyces humi TaxID=1428620 RepID=UPI0007C65759|nr:4'-phosphopantetheinyl transferase superfamily protein [Streptomyces humi]